MAAHVNNDSKTEISNLQGWDLVIADAKKRIQELQFSLEVFQKNRREGRPFSQAWLSDETARTEKKSVPA